MYEYLLLKYIKMNMNYRYKYNDGTNGFTELFTISQELPNYTRRYTNFDYYLFHQAYNKSIYLQNKKEYIDDCIKNKRGRYICWNEKLADFGRLVFDFDFKKGDDNYNIIVSKFPLNKYEPNGFIEEIQSLIKHALINLGYKDLVNVLDMNSIKWYDDIVCDWNTKVSPWCWSTCCREDKISYHLTLPFITCIKEKIDHGYMKEEVISTCPNLLQNTLRLIYSEITRLFNIKYNCDINLIDMEMCKSNHDLRLPGMTKRDNIGSKEHTLKFISNHNIMHAISCVQLYMIPSSLYMILDNSLFVGYEISAHKDIQYDSCDEDERDSIWELLQEYYPDITSLYNDIKFKKGSRISVFQLIRKNSECICPVCMRKHKKTDPFIQKSFGRYILTCWRWISKGEEIVDLNGPKELGTYEFEGEETLDEWKDRTKANAINRYKPLYSNVGNIPKEKIQYINEMEMPIRPYDKDTYICSPMASCKTKGVYVDVSKYDSYCFLSTRIIQASKYNKDMKESTLYKSEKDWRKVKRLVVQLESFHSVTTPSFDVLILDEIETLLRILKSKTLGDPLTTISRLIYYLTVCKKVIVLDAFLKAETVKWIIDIRGKDYDVIINMYKSIQRNGNRHVKQYKTKNMWVAKIKGDSRRKVIACMSKKIAKGVYDMLMGKGEKSLLITSETPDHIKYMDPNGENSWCMYHNIIYTPALANSISYEKNRFDILYVYACKGSCSPEDLIQMTGRVRSLSDQMVHLYVNRYFGTIDRKLDEDEMEKELSLSKLGRIREWLPTNEKAVHKYMMYRAKIFGNKVVMPIFANMWNVIGKNIQNLYARIMVDNGLGQRCFEEVLHSIMIDLGWTIETGVEYEEKIKLPKYTVSANKTDMDVYLSYINKEWKESMDVYHNVWLKGKQSNIKTIASIVREYDNTDEKNTVAKPEQINQDLDIVFSIGEQVFDHTSGYTTLVFETKDWMRLEPVVTRLGSWFGVRPGKHKWEWLGKFFYDVLLIKGTVKSSSLNNKRMYTYKLYFDNSIWCNIKMR